jgi:hypothetical protein
MPFRGLIILAVLLVSSTDVFAGERSGIFHRASCSVVRYYVVKYSEAAAEGWARAKGATEADIEAARGCLKGMPIQTAQSAQ